MKNTTGKLARKRRAVHRLAFICSFVGTLLLLAVILSAVPLTVPRLFGLQPYHVVSGSMEPTLPVGSIVNVEDVSAEEILPGEIIAFRELGSAVTHRVVENRRQEGCFITKGDANNMVDINPVPYGTLLGRVKWTYPMLGQIMALYAAPSGKLSMGILAVCGLLFCLTGSRLREHEKALRKQIMREKAKKEGAEAKT